jgi:hypothetical protein
MALGNSSQEKAHGRQIVGRRLRVLSRCSNSWKASLGRSSEWIVHRHSFEISSLILDPGRTLKRPNPIGDRYDPAIHEPDAGTEIARAGHRRMHRAKGGVLVTFTVYASRGEHSTKTVRLSVAVAIAKGRTLAEEGWQVFITGPDGMRHYPSEFDKLLAYSPALHSRD